MYNINDIRNTVLYGDVLEELKKLPDNSVDCVVTSPPYFGLRKYDSITIVGGDPECKHEFESKSGKESETGKCKLCGAWRGEIGLEESFNEYVNHIVSVCDEVKRVLKTDGTFFLNIGDTYGGSGNGHWEGAKVEDNPKRYNKGAVPAEIGEKGRDTKQYSKSLLNLPHQIVIKMVMEKGWIHRNTIIWQKTNAMPESCSDRFMKSYEFIFFFTKSKDYNFKPITETKELKGGWKPGEEEVYKELTTKLRKSFLSLDEITKQGLKKDVDYEEITRSKSDTKHYIINLEDWKKPCVCGQELKRHFGYQYDKVVFIPCPFSKKIRDIWEFPTQPLKFKHFASYPEELVHRCLQSGCPPKEGERRIVLDPFMGTGTTGVVAMVMGIDYIGIELNQKDYKPIIEERIANALTESKLAKAGVKAKKNQPSKEHREVEEAKMSEPMTPTVVVSPEITVKKTEGITVVAPATSTGVQSVVAEVVKTRKARGPIKDNTRSLAEYAEANKGTTVTETRIQLSKRFGVSYVTTGKILKAHNVTSAEAPKSGRPFGSKNKVKVSTETTVVAQPAQMELPLNTENPSVVA